MKSLIAQVNFTTKNNELNIDAQDKIMNSNFHCLSNKLCTGRSNENFTTSISKTRIYDREFRKTRLSTSGLHTERNPTVDIK